MDGRSIGQLAKLAVRERRFKQLRGPRTIGREDQTASVRPEGALQKVRGVIDGGLVCDLIYAPARSAIGKC